MIRIKSVSDPFTTPRLVAKGAAVLARADAMGLVPEDVVSLDAGTLARLATRVGRAGIGAALMPAVAVQSAALEQYLDQLTAALEASPVPPLEWKPLVRVLGVDRLARMLGVSAPSIRRYVRSVRQTPDDVAVRLHWLALVVGDLAGAYNEIGVRQWFDRKRGQLDGRTPAQLLAHGWKPDDPGPQKVRTLAHALIGSPAT